MRMYVVAMATGVLVGMIYAVLEVRSPAPPVVALVGLLGILMGEQVVPLAKRLLAGKPVGIGWLKTDCAQQVRTSCPHRRSRLGLNNADRPRLEIATR
jgi:XapX domain-containing protein